MTRYFGPYLSNRRPVIGDMIPLTIPPGNKTRPAANAVIRRLPLRYIGNKIATDKINIIHRNTISRPIVNIGNLKTRRLSIG
ncbi:hypothetical protein D3C81_1636340 [compost metagenome]